ncbi:HlyD family type I secretion periplasmic adaptor subunit [Verrucomicrobiales bacterium BCK34]|nr:HlyD family type I secretion periplasmic adaptor subunit [Verrucomicrobiales bacterium BCK34]
MNPFNPQTIHSADLDFIKDAKTAVRSEKIRGANFLLVAVAASIISLVVWANYAQLDEVTKGQGKVIPSSSIQTVQNLEGGIVSEILISEGDRVSKGDILVRLDDTLRNSSYRENLSKAQAFEAELARLVAEGKGYDEILFPENISEKRPDLVAREISLFNKRRAERVEQQEIFLRSLKLASEELTMTIPLVQKRIVSKVEQLRLEREVNEIEGKLQELLGGFQQESMERYNAIKAELEGLNEAIHGRQDTVDRALVRSPVEGVVNKLYVATIGGVIQGGEPIADIVPDDDSLLIEAKIRPQDIAFLRPDQEATLKFTAYDFSLYGGLKGKLEHISADTIEDEIDKEHYYMIKVRNENGKLIKDGEELPVIPGMVVEVDILTGQRTVLQYLTKPFHRMRFNALRER